MTKVDTALQKTPASASGNKLPVQFDPNVHWNTLPEVTLNTNHLNAKYIVTAERAHPAHAAFDMLRTRLLQTLAEYGWTRLAITAPTRGCGSSFVTANLALSVARLKAVSTVVLDVDVRERSLHSTLGITPRNSMSEYLKGMIAPEDFFVRTSPNLAFGLNNQNEYSAAEIFQDEMASDVLDELQDLLNPDLILFDLPPALEHDDALAILPKVDCVLLVAGAGESKPEDITKLEQVLSDVKPVLGVMLNKANS